MVSDEILIEYAECEDCPMRFRGTGDVGIAAYSHAHSEMHVITWGRKFLTTFDPKTGEHRNGGSPSAFIELFDESA